MTESELQLTDKQIGELQHLKQYFPYRIVFGVLKEGGEFEAYAAKTKHRLNAALRNGHAVFTIGS